MKRWTHKETHKGRFKPRYLREKPLTFSSSEQLKSWIEVESGKGCRLPSCSKLGDPDNFNKHHWDFRGREENSFNHRDKIHLLCPACHDRVHKIAALVVLYLEVFSSLALDDLVSKVTNDLAETSDNVKFVLSEEMKPAGTGIVQIKKGKCRLIKKKIKQISKIKKYLKFHHPELRDKSMSNQ